MTNQSEFSPAERREWAGRFGVAPSAIDHDHLISHLLLALSTWGEDVLFYGGTALSRTHLSGFRLSEDIDLQIESPGRHVEALGDHLVRAIRRDYPAAAWERRPAPRGQTIAYLRADELAVRVLKDVFGQVVVRQEFDRLRPSIIQAWEGELERLMREIPRPEECLRRVRGAYAESLGWGTITITTVV